jgi:hypothetical protein
MCRWSFILPSQTHGLISDSVEQTETTELASFHGLGVEDGGPVDLANTGTGGLGKQPGGDRNKPAAAVREAKHTCHVAMGTVEAWGFLGAAHHCFYPGILYEHQHHTSISHFLSQLDAINLIQKPFLALLSYRSWLL